MMQKKNVSRSVFIATVIIFIGIMVVFLGESVKAKDKRTKQILILNPYSNYKSTVTKLEDKDWAGEIMSAINEEIIKNKIDLGINVEYMAFNQDYSEEYIKDLYDLYEGKFKNKKFDAVVTIDDNAFDFVIKYGKKLFSNTPVVFGGVSNLDENILKSYDNIVGIKKSEDIKNTIDMALKIHPDIKKIFVITDNNINGSVNRRKIKEIAPKYKNKVKFIFSKEENEAYIKEKTSNLSKDTVILLEGWIKDDTGECIPAKDAGKIIKKMNRPVYSTWDAYLENGTVGGVITDGYDYGKNMSQLVLKIIKGENVKNIKTIEDSAHKYKVDYEQLKKFDIDLERLPENSKIVNKPERAYKIYKKIFWCIIILIIAISIFVFLYIKVRRYKYEIIKQSLNDSENLFSTIINATPDIICCINYEGELLEANKSSLELLNVPNKTYKNKNLYNIKDDIFSLEKEWKDFKEHNEKAWRFRTVYRSEEKIHIKGNDKKKVYDVLRIPLFNSDATPKMMILLGRDITSHKLNEKNEKIIRELRYYNKIKTDFFSNISHELRTPLNVIYAALQVIDVNSSKDLQSQNKKLKKYTKIMKQNCFRLLRIINNLIDITKIDAGHFSMNIKNYDVINIVEDIVLSIADYVESKGISIIFDTEVEEKEMAFDADAMERIVLNLLSNAVKFTPKGGKIEVNIYDRGEYIVISVKDTGVGIPVEKQKAIFERFIQVDKSFSRRREGSGIGLSLIKELIEMQGGEIRLKSEKGKGSEFIVKMPIKVLPKSKEDIYDESNCFNDDKVKRIQIEFSDIYNY